MTRDCLRVCEKYEKTFPSRGKRYVEGVRRCNNCEIYIQWTIEEATLAGGPPKFTPARCPCCRSRLRSKPKNQKKN